MPKDCCNFVDPELNTTECEPARLLLNEISQDSETVAHYIEVCKKRRAVCIRRNKLESAIEEGEKHLASKKNQV